MNFFIPQHQSGLDYLYYADGEAWVVGATFGGPRVGIVNFERKVCPYQVTAGTWRHSVNGKLERDSGIVLKCLDPAAAAEAADGEAAETVGHVTLSFLLEVFSPRGGTSLGSGSEARALI